MLEGLVTWFLNNYLGKYLKNLNTGQLSIALLQGEVELEHVPLRRDALRFLNSAVDVRSGFVGRIRLKIPVARMRSEPWSITLEQVYIVTGPQTFANFDPDACDALAQELKLSALDGIESEWRAEHDVTGKSSGYYPSYSSWMSYGTSFIGTIVENLQIQIKDVHIRYEDDLSLSSSFACGFFIESLTAQTCNENFEPSFVQRDHGQVHAFKLVELHNMGGYLDVDAEMFGSLSTKDLEEKMRVLPSCEDDVPPRRHSFLLNPVSATARVTRNCTEKPLNSQKTPRVKCDLSLEGITLELSDRQFQSVVAGGRTLLQVHKNQKYWKWRPELPVHGNAKQWWQYAITCHMEVIHDRNDAIRSATIIRKASENVRYVESFKAYLLNPVALDEDLRKHKDEMDATRSYEELKALRDIAVFHLSGDQGHEEDDFFVSTPDEQEDSSGSAPVAEAQSASLLQRYFPLWYGASQESLKDIGTKASQSNPDLSAFEEELLEVLASDETSVVTYKDVVFANLTFSMDRGSLRLHSEAQKRLYPSSCQGSGPLFQFDFEAVKAEAESRPRTSSYKLSLTLGSLQLKDMLTPGSMFPLLLSPQSLHGAPLNAATRKAASSGVAVFPVQKEKEHEQEPLFYFLYELNPFPVHRRSPQQFKRTDLRLHVRSRPLNVVYNPSVFRCVAEFFRFPEEEGDPRGFSAQSHKIFSAALDRIEEAKQKTKEELVKNLHSLMEGQAFERKTWDLVIELSTPKILIPEHFVDTEALITVIDLGMFKLTNAKEDEEIHSTACRPQHIHEDEDDDGEEFCTPASSPGSPDGENETTPANAIALSKSLPLVRDGPGASMKASSINAQPSPLTEVAIVERMYDRFRMSLSGVQVIVGKVKDNWQQAHLRGQSSLHVLDRFSIGLECQRRVVEGIGPEWPSLVVQGSMPSLVVHVNEEKMQAMESLTRLLIGDVTSLSSYWHSSEEVQSASSRHADSDLLWQAYSFSPSSSSDESAKLLQMQFCVADLRVELQSQAKSIAELQVTGVNLSLVKFPFVADVDMSVHSLVLVDALQSFGSEMLVTSQRSASDKKQGTPGASSEAVMEIVPKEDHLVHIKVVEVDPRASDFLTKHRGINRFVDVDFNTLDINFNLETWVIVLDLLGIGAAPVEEATLPVSQVNNKQSSRQEDDAEQVKGNGGFQMEIHSKVRSLSLVLNKSSYSVAAATVDHFKAKMTTSEGNFSIGGTLGSFSLRDLTPTQGGASKYSDRFLSRGENVLTFKLFKYGRPDEDLKRPDDAELSIQMSSIIYVHTQRFYSEIISFFHQFQQLQNAMNRIRDATAGRRVKAFAARGSRIRLDVEATNPLLLLPMSSYSDQILAVDLGMLQLRNTFKFSGDEGTISAATSVRTNDDLEGLGARSRRSNRGSTSIRSRSSNRSPRSQRKSLGRRSRRDPGSDVMSQLEEDEIFAGKKQPHRCLLDVMIATLDSADLLSATRLDTPVTNNESQDATDADVMAVGDDYAVKINQKCPILKEKFRLKLQIERNLDKAFCNKVPDLSVKGQLSRLHAAVDSSQYVLIRGLLGYNLGENLDDLDFQVPTTEYADPSTSTILTGEVWNCVFMDFELLDVVVDLLIQHEDLPNHVRESTLARINFLKSRLIFESFSDSSRDVDLVSREILLSDLRFDDFPANLRANVFTQILQPMQMAKRKSPLQAEVHLRATQDTNRFTILLNNMRLMVIFDWWLSVLEFISKAAEDPTPYEEDKEEKMAKKDKTTKVFLQEEPLYPSAGVISRRVPLVETRGGGPVFELRLNITDSEVIVVADASTLESSTVILRSTTVVAFRPDLVDRPFSCNLNNAEVFSCILGKEEESALSIIDPVTINFEIGGRSGGGLGVGVGGASKGLMDLASAANQSVERTAEIQLQQLNLRLSYHDWLMFLVIMESFPKQFREAIYGKNDEQRVEPGGKMDDIPVNMQPQISRLMALGFGRDDCIRALAACSGQVDNAAIWLTQHAVLEATPSTTPKTEVSLASSSPKKKQPQHQQGHEQRNAAYLEGTPISFSGIELKTSSVNVCIIDDCRDADVPLLETTLTHLHLKHSVAGEGEAAAVIAGSYYNRALSSWEPFLEPWRCSLDWRIRSVGNCGAQKLSSNLTTRDVINVNITSTLLDLFQTVKANWTEDYYHNSLDDSEWILDRHMRHRHQRRRGRRRAPFVPFALCNATGCHLAFCTQTRMSGSQFGPSISRSRAHSGTGEIRWLVVPPGETVPFTFEEPGKLRHMNSHDMKIHQIVVCVTGWEEVSPVSVDRVGTYFRRADPIKEYYPDVGGPELPPARIVFDVSLDGSAKKLITVRSALLVRNKLQETMALKLENTAMKIGDVKELSLLPGQTMPIPLDYVWSRIFAKPSLKSPNFGYCSRPINWYHILTKQDNSLEVHNSNHTLKRTQEPYRFAVSVRRQNYPLGSGPGSLLGDPLRSGSTPAGSRTNPGPSSWIQPGHLITFMSPLVVVNLLPCHLTFKTNNGGNGAISIKPGKESYLSVDLSQQIVLSLSLDQYPGAAEVILPPNNSSSFEARMKLADTQDRPLFLNVRVLSVYGGAVRVTVLAPVWIVNKTGLPIVFRQEGAATNAAGQDVEHEVARMGAPLMFSFLEREGNQSIVMRIGNGLHKDGKPTWCRHFYVLQSGSSVRRLRVTPSDNHRAEWVYTIGIEIRAGKGRYRDTQIITLAPRFQLYNQSRHRVLFSQKCFASIFYDPQAEATHLLALPQSSLAFHWPRLDKEQLLCIRLRDIEDCQWSGGFRIEQVSSFHVTLRDVSGRSTFIRIEIGMLGATFSIILTDAGNFPPPFRIDNFSEVRITYHQAGVEDESRKCSVKPHHSLPYAWDEPNLPPHLTCTAPGDCSATYNMNMLGEGASLTYENFIYIAMTATFLFSESYSAEGSSAMVGSGSIEGQELVLDVEGTKVFLSKKETGRRSQLWRMTSTGMLQHEGSSPPQDPQRPRNARNDNNALVLDIALPAVQPKSQVSLMLRKSDERRALTQRWRFTEDGRLMSTHNGLYVQAKDGFMGMHRGSEVVLGPPSPVSYLRMPSSSIPVEQAISRQRLRPGSGFLSVRVTTDGPTRVLQISDVKQKKVYARMDERDWLLINEDKRPSTITFGEQHPRAKPLTTSKTDRQSHEQEFQIVILAKAGIGISLVSRDPPEELVYAFMSNVVVDYETSALQKTLDGSVQNIQIDSQLVDAHSPIVMYLSPSSKTDEQRHMPAVHFTANKSASMTENAEIFKHLMVTVKNMSFNLEEELMLKLFKFAGFAKSDEELEGEDESAYEAQRAMIAATANAKRYYFGNLKLTLNQVKLSVTKSKTKLNPDLQVVKRKLGLSLITFEDANIELDPFVRSHPFETINFLTNAVIKHYNEELHSQAALILGSTDFLGNPIGFINDFREGVSGLVSDGNVGGLIKNVVHGSANSAAKVTGSLSAGLSMVAGLDERYDERRLMLRRRRGEKSKEHLWAGLKGLGFGLLGGATSVVTETYDGAAADGVAGFFTGLGWGLVGTFSKPAIGVLDLATGTATAIKESSRSASKQLPLRLRPPRLVVGPGGSMPVYSERDGLGQERLYRMNGRDYREIYVAHETLRSGDSDLQILITSERVLVFCIGSSAGGADNRASSAGSMSSAVTKHLRTVSHFDLISAKAVFDQDESSAAPRFYVEMVVQPQPDDDGRAPVEKPKPKVRCDSERLARTVATQINYAKNMFEERAQAVKDDELDEQEE